MTEYRRPSDIATALRLKAEYAAAGRPLVVLAGGTDIYPTRATRAGWGQMHHADVLDISAIQELRGITSSADGWHIGALATWTDVTVARHLPSAFDGLRRAAREVGGAQIQNRGTLVGNVCTASPAADGIPCLLTLEAIVAIGSVRGNRRVPLCAFVTDARRTAHAPDEIVLGIEIPRQSGLGAFRKLGARRYLVISIAMVAAVVESTSDGRVTSARIAIGACSAVARRQPLLEAFLAGRCLATVTAEQLAPELFTNLAPLDDLRASARFRHHVAIALTRDVLTTVTRDAHEKVE